jgi:riboflavin transporter FmnP
MSEADYLELMILARDSLAYHGMNYFTFLFGFLLAAYFAAERLSIFQLILLLPFYAVLPIFPCAASYEAAREYSFLTVEYYSKFRSDMTVPTFAESGFLLLPYILAGSWIISVIFMFQTRHSRIAEKVTTNKTIESDT